MRISNKLFDLDIINCVSSRYFYSVMEISIRLKNIRERKNLSQEYVGNALGIGQSGYNKIENSKREVTVKELIKLSEIFEIGIDKLLNDNYSEKETFNNLNENSINYNSGKGYEVSVTIKITDPGKEKQILELIKNLNT